MGGVLFFLKHQSTKRFPIYSEQIANIVGISSCRETSNTYQSSGITNAFGIGVFPPSDILDPRALDALQELGIKWVRIDFSWNTLDPQQKDFDSKKDESLVVFDKIVTELGKRNIQIQAIINNSPSWAKEKDWVFFSDQAASFANTLVNRYKPGGTLAKQNGWQSYGVRHWEIFNEPNFPCCGWLQEGMSGEDAGLFVEEYVQVLTKVNVAIRKADPDAVILLGGLSDQPNSKWAMPHDLFLRKVYELGAKSCFDVVAIHPYELLGRFAEGRDAMKSIMKEFGDENKPIWYNEFGTNNNARQEEALRQTMKDRNSVPFFIWFSLRDFGGGNTYGLLREDFSKKPTFFLMKELLH